MLIKNHTALRTIGEVASDLGVEQHVLRFWESKFSQIRPIKRSGKRRYYRPEDIAVLQRIQHMLYHQGYTIRGAQQVLRTSTAAVLTDPQPEQQGSDDYSVSRQEPAPSLATDSLSSNPSEAEKTLGGDASGTASLTVLLHELKSIRALLTEALVHDFFSPPYENECEKEDTPR